MANPKLTIDIDGNSKQFESSLNSLERIAKASAIAIAGAFGAVTTAIAGSIVAGSNFEQQMSSVQAISGATADTMDILTQKAKDLGIESAFSATQAGQAFEYMALAGWDANDMLNGIEGVMNLAAASGEDLALVSDIVTDSMTAFGLSASDATHFADVLAQTSAKSNTNVAMLGDAFTYVGSVAGALNYSIEDTAVALGLMANSGIKGSQAGTALRATLTRLVKPTDESAQAMELLGVEVANADGTMKPLNDVLLQLRDGFKKLTPEQQASTAGALAGQEAMSGLLAVVQTSDEDFNKLYTSINDATGKAQEMADIKLDNLTGQITLMKSSIEGVGITIFDSIKAPLTDAVKGAIENINDLNASLSSELQPVLQDMGKQLSTFIGTLASSLADLLPTLIEGFVTLFENIDKVGLALASLTGAFIAFRTQAVLTTVITAFLNLTKAIQGASLAQNLLNLAMAANPIGLLIKAIGAVVGAIVYLWNTNERFKLNFQKLWQELVYDFKQLINSLIVDINKLIAKFNAVSGSKIEPLGRLDIKPQLQAIEELAFALSDLDVAKIKAEEGAELVSPEEIQGIKDYSNEINNLSTSLNSVGGGTGIADDLVGPTIAPEVLAERIANQETADQAGSIIANAISSGIQDGFDEDTNIMEAIGQNLIQSLADSMLNWANSLLANAVSDIAGMVTGGFLSEFDINSPSRVFWDMGKDDMVGLRDGLVDNAGLVTTKIKGISDGIMNAFSSVNSPSLAIAGAGGYGGGVVINNINNSSSAQVQTTQSTNANGQIEITNLIIDAVAKDISKGGTVSQAIDFKNSKQAKVNR